MRSLAGLTLVELILAAVLSVIAAAAVISGYNFLFTQTKSGIGRGNLNLQIDYALEKIRLQCLSASAVDEAYLFESGDTSQKDSLCISGENDPYNIDIGDKTNDMEYCYYVEDDKLMLSAEDVSGASSTEVLIGERFKPRITFEYTVNSEPNYITAAITATAKNIGGQDKEIVKKEGIRFWYTTVTQ